MRSPRGLAALLAAVVALFAATTCRSGRRSVAHLSATPGPRNPARAATVTPAPTPTPPAALPPGTTPMPVATPSSPSTYDRQPGVLYEESRPAPPTPVVPTPRPPKTAAPSRASSPSSARRTPTRKPGAYYEDADVPLRGTPTPTPTPTAGRPS